MGFLWGIFLWLLTLLYHWLWLLWSTVGQWIAYVAAKATTVWQMINDATLCIQSTLTWARIATFLLHTSTMRGTIAIQDTLGTTSLVGIAKVVGQARAGAYIAMRTTNCIRTTRIGLTRIRWGLRVYKLWCLYRCHCLHWWYVWWWRWLTSGKWIAN